MKKILNIVIVGLSLCSMVSCDDINSIHQKYLDMEETHYAGSANVQGSNIGYERIELIWKVTKDPKLKETCIYWNNGLDSVIVPIDRSDTVMRKSFALKEGEHSFEIWNRTFDGDVSLSQLYLASCYGENYRKTLSNRPIVTQAMRPDGVAIVWGAVDNCVGIDFTYTDSEGNEKLIEVEADATTTFIPDFQSNGAFSYTTFYLPEATALDVVSTLSVASGQFGEMKPKYVLEQDEWESGYMSIFEELDRSTWTAKATRELGTITMNDPTSKIFDGSESSYWENNWADGSEKLPYTIDIDMQSVQEFSVVEVCRRTQNYGGHLKDLLIEYSTDNIAWTKFDDMLFATNNTGEGSQAIMFTGAGSLREARYFRLTITSSHAGKDATMAEFKLYNLKPLE